MKISSETTSCAKVPPKDRGSPERASPHHTPQGSSTPRWLWRAVRRRDSLSPKRLTDCRSRDDRRVLGPNGLSAHCADGRTVREIRRLKMTSEKASGSSLTSSFSWRVSKAKRQFARLDFRRKLSVVSQFNHCATTASVSLGVTTEPRERSDERTPSEWLWSSSASVVT